VFFKEGKSGGPRSKAVAKEVEKQRRRELKEGFHNISNARDQGYPLRK